MIPPELPDNEANRLKALESYELLDTLPESDYDDIVRIASLICDTPISLVTLIDKDRQYFKARKGLDVNETPREFAFCAHAINKPNELLIVPDSRQDLRFMDNPLVSNDPHVVFYAGVPLVNEDGHALGTLCVIDHKPRELTREQEASLKSLGKQVMNVMSLRKKNRLLEESQRKTEQYGKDMEAFAYSASHDLKEPLRNIKAFMQLLERNYANQLDDKAQKYIHFSIESANKMETLMRDLLDYYKSDNDMEPATLVDPSKLIKEILVLHQDQIAKKNVNITVGKLPQISITAAALRQVFYNIISNALKYHNEGSTPEITIEAKELDQYWEFSVSDNGIGIAQAYLNKIFDIFTRLHSYTQYKGTGIGLAICRRIIKKHGGEIWATSENEVGSTFYFTLPK